MWWIAIDSVIFILLMGIIGKILGEERVSNKSAVIIILAVAMIHLSTFIFTRISMK